MKKLILSLAALAFATYLFSQDDSSESAPASNQDTVVVVKSTPQNDARFKH